MELQSIFDKNIIGGWGYSIIIHMDRLLTVLEKRNLETTHNCKIYRNYSPGDYTYTITSESGALENLNTVINELKNRPF